MRAPVKQVRPLITLTDASGQQSTMDTNTRDKFVVTPQILSYYSELKMWTVDKKKLGALCGIAKRYFWQKLRHGRLPKRISTKWKKLKVGTELPRGARQ